MGAEPVVDGKLKIFRSTGTLSRQLLADLLGEQQVETLRTGNYEVFTRLPFSSITTAISSGQLHRLNGPALQGHSEDQRTSLEVWFQQGQVHRDQDPAIIASAGEKRIEERWAQAGQLHRLDGPAAIMGGDSVLRVEYWFQDGQLHADEQAAIIIRIAGDITTEYWYRHGVQHRDDGPAIIHRRKPIGNQYFLNGQELTFGRWQQQTLADAG